MEQAKGITDRSTAKRHIKNYLLDKRFQLRWVLRIVIATIIIVAIMGYLLYQTVADATDQILAQKLGDLSLTRTALDAFLQQNARDKAQAFWMLGGGLAGLVLLLAAVTIVLTHRIAGPVYKMRKLFATIDGDHLRLSGRLRKSDELQDAFSDFEKMIKRIRDHRRADIETLVSLRDFSKEGVDSKEVAKRLNDLIVRYQKSV